MSVALTLIRFVHWFSSFFLSPIIEFVFKRIYGVGSPVPSVPDNSILLLSATELARRIRLRQLTSVEAVEAYVNRITDVNHQVNAVVAERFQEAIAEAINVDRVLDSVSEKLKLPDIYSEQNAPFLGVPFTAKDAIGIKGIPQTSGLFSRASSVCQVDADTVRMMRSAGAIPLAVTNVSELCMWYESSNTLHGQTRNPYDDTRIVGGSSGGEACIIAAAGSIFGIGSDIGGSLRMPAFFNGIYAHKPSSDIVSNEGQFPNASGKEREMLVTGPMCRYAVDLLPMLKALAGPEQSARLKLDDNVELKNIKFYSMCDDAGGLLLSPVTGELKNAQEKLVHELRNQLKFEVEEVCIKGFRRSLDMWSGKMSAAGGTPFNVLMANNQEKIEAVNCNIELFKWIFGLSRHTLPAILLGLVESLKKPPPMIEESDKLREQVAELLKDNGVLLYPTHPKIAPYHSMPVFYPFNFAYTGIFNVLGFPVTQCPLGLSSDGLPLGIQVVANKNMDRLALAVAKLIEERHGGWTPPWQRNV